MFGFFVYTRRKYTMAEVQCVEAPTSHHPLVEMFYNIFDGSNERKTANQLPGFTFPPLKKNGDVNFMYCEIILCSKFQEEPKKKNTDVYWYKS